MKTLSHINHLKVQTNSISKDFKMNTIENTAKGLSLYYKDGNFYYQTFFTPPILGELNQIEGLANNGQVHIRSVSKIGPNLFHIRCSGKENDVRAMIQHDELYNLTTALEGKLSPVDNSRRFLDMTTQLTPWNLLCSTEMRKGKILNHVKMKGKTIQINNILTINNRLLGITDNSKVVMGTLTPEILEKDNVYPTVEPVDTINNLGKIDLMAQIPNTDEAFLVSVGNNIYEFTFWGDIIHFNSLEDSVHRINSIHFNNTRGLVATDNGLYEMDVMEVPNMVKPLGFPKQIINPTLKQNIEMALYVEDPDILGIQPAVGVVTKTGDNKILFF
ncbi:MAG: hypothetical protein Kow00108_27150 [Calditrichia bacterium]